MAVAISLLVLPNVQAQLSPGNLTSAHEALEGVANCTQCHTLGEKISDAKCLACHEEIQIRINSRSGYHASREVQRQECADCHSEHHGRKFDMVRFDEDKFNHQLTGYELTGAHQRIDCRQCHLPDLIEDRELRQRKDTYLGLSTNCADCHDDYHQHSLSNQCADCHTTDHFVPASRFDHNQTDFALRGQHEEVDCVACHQKETRNGQAFQVFAGIPFANCNACHEDVHDYNLGDNCKQCHIEDSFTARSGLRRFNHSQTNFALKGSHRKVNCAKCHNMDLSLTRIFQDRLGVFTQDCAVCHEDVHDQKFGNNCIDCHQETSFQDVKTDNFNHMLTGFQLKGKHNGVDCRSCHTQSLVEPLPHNTCAACHDDYHEGDFTSSPIVVRDCAECHNEDGFERTLYTLEQHNQSSFPLTGSHLATPCFACHQQEGKWTFSELGSRCVDCHEDVHLGYIDAQFYPDQNCLECHVTDSWDMNRFDHTLTGFPLRGAHATQSCMACHSPEENTNAHPYSGFQDPAADCVSCHENVHNDQFARNGVTDCTRCHSFNSWDISQFNHDQTDFKLEGRHAEIACEACHMPTIVDGVSIIQYQFNSFECADCHQ